MNKVFKWIEKAIEIFVTVFGAFIAYQLLRKILGGSWATEDILIGLVIFNIATLFSVAILLTQLKSDFKHHKSQFSALTRDFKETAQIVSALSHKK